MELARKHGLYRTARTLPIDYANLSKRMNSSPPPPEVSRRPEFLELFPTPAQPGCCVEVLRVQVSGPVDWSQLLRAWRQSP